MKTFRARIVMNGGYISKLQSDTVFGGLCWAIKMHEEDTVFSQLLDLCRANKPPFVVSDMFPGDLLPKPFGMTANKKESEQMTKAERLERAKAAKKQKEIKWLTYNEYAAWSREGILTCSTEAKPFKSAMVLHNSINRITGSTLEEGGLYEHEENFITSEVEYLSLYVRVKEDWLEILKKAIDLFGKMGIGKRRSVGKGSFDVKHWDECTVFNQFDGANGFMSLSHFIPEKLDPVEGCYKTTVKYPRLDRENAFLNNPFKHPIILLLPGSVFYCGHNPKDYYGQAVQNISPGLPQAIQGCYAFTAPIRIIQGA